MAAQVRAGDSVAFRGQRRTAATDADVRGQVWLVRGGNVCAKGLEVSRPATDGERRAQLRLTAQSSGARGDLARHQLAMERLRAGALPSLPMATTRDVMINFRATEPERAALHAAAERCGMSLTAWLREVALAAAGESDLLRDLERARRRAEKLER